MSLTYSNEQFAAFLENQLQALNTLNVESAEAKDIKAKLALLIGAFVFFLRSKSANPRTKQGDMQEITVRLPVSAYNALMKRSLDHEPPMEPAILIAYILGSDLARTGHFIPDGEIDEALLDRGREVGVLIPTNILADIDAARHDESRQEMIRRVLRDWAATR